MKDWLIRTKQNQILGPVTLEKIKELIEKGSLVDNDEICQGNGIWFWVKEKDLLNKYVYKIEESKPAENLPSDEDLEFPE